MFFIQLRPIINLVLETVTTGQEWEHVVSPNVAFQVFKRLSRPFAKVNAGKMTATPNCTEEYLVMTKVSIFLSRNG